MKSLKRIRQGWTEGEAKYYLFKNDDFPEWYLNQSLHIRNEIRHQAIKFGFYGGNLKPAMDGFDFIPEPDNNSLYAEYIKKNEPTNKSLLLLALASSLGECVYKIVFSAIDKQHKVKSFKDCITRKGKLSRKRLQDWQSEEVGLFDRDTVCEILGIGKTKFIELCKKDEKFLVEIGAVPGKKYIAGYDPESVLKVAQKRAAK